MEISYPIPIEGKESPDHPFLSPGLLNFGIPSPEIAIPNGLVIPNLSRRLKNASGSDL